ncbi:inorganic polyphosphate kinase [Tenacibaculum holothuriorum]|uniref:NAD kinase n=1 Tax=Tenacibaculum holothuriorum TaxID=1635173 RepID=A0A1Y2P8R9_9FLAO|nr:NAD kinase [Tenacibaculum holothuriorum]OSY86856.1 inorganic polyphosphate kinase [Tenacibaculum holothuriorum]
MKKVAIYGQSYTITAEKEINILLEILEENTIEVLFEKEFYNLLLENNSLSKTYDTFSHFNDLSSEIDVMFTIGGDGTILRAVTFIRNLDIPVIGINTGRLGFLATVQKDQIKEAVNAVLNKEYTIQERSLLQITTTPSTEEFSELNFALNEITIARRNTTSMIGVKTYLNGEYLTNYWADGLIIATPTGSTGYSLSCEGPVVLPNSKSFVITPIAPHNLNARPMVIPDETTIELEVSAREKDYLISLDSRITTATQKTKIKIEKASFTIKSVLLKNQSYLKTLRGKLLWGEDTRNESM